MKESLVQYLACPDCGGEINISSSKEVDLGGGIKEGEVACKSCRSLFPIINYIPRFVSADNYASSFGFQWNYHARTQIDRFTGLTITRDRFYFETGWKEESLEGQKMLEAGCGAGRFTQIALETGAKVFSFDYSNAVEACLQNSGFAPNLHIVQADIYHIPFQKRLFDKVFCFGVLHHCPDVEKAFLNLIPFLKSGGEIVVDAYSIPRITMLKIKYWMRPLTRRLSPRLLHYLLRIIVPLFFPVKIWLSESSSELGRKIGRAIPIVSYKGIYPLSQKQLLEWAVLDTFDMLSPRYDQPQSIAAVEEWFVHAGLVDVEVKEGPYGVQGKGRKK